MLYDTLPLLCPGARRDKDGYLWVTGRIDDMLNVSGHLLSTSEVESALVEHRSVAEAAVVAHPHDIKGEALYCFITLKDVRLDDRNPQSLYSHTVCFGNLKIYKKY